MAAIKDQPRPEPKKPTKAQQAAAKNKAHVEALKQLSKGDW